MGPNQKPIALSNTPKTSGWKQELLFYSPFCGSQYWLSREVMLASSGVTQATTIFRKQTQTVWSKMASLLTTVDGVSSLLTLVLHMRVSSKISKIEGPAPPMSAFQASACLTVANVLWAKASHMTNPSQCGRRLRRSSNTVRCGPLRGITEPI